MWRREAGAGIDCRNDFEKRPVMRLLSVVCIGVVLSACQNTRDRERCLSYGFIDGTSSFSRCLQRFDSKGTAGASVRMTMVAMTTDGVDGMDCAAISG